MDSSASSSSPPSSSAPSLSPPESQPLKAVNIFEFFSSGDSEKQEEKTPLPPPGYDLMKVPFLASLILSLIFIPSILHWKDPFFSDDPRGDVSDDENECEFGAFSSSSHPVEIPIASNGGGENEAWDDGEWVSGNDTTDSEKENILAREKGKCPGETVHQVENEANGKGDGDGDHVYTRVLEGRGLLASEDSGDEWVSAEEEEVKEVVGEHSEKKEESDWCKWD
jgi:hypothetical protein